MSVALVFSGQGHQHSAMLPWLQEDAIVQAMCARLGTRDWRAAMSDPAWARRNANAQVLLTGLALAAWRQLSSHLPAVAAVAGYSVGELPAFSVAGVFDAETALDLARRRAELMDSSGVQQPGGLMAVTGLMAPGIDAICAAAGADIAIRNCPTSVVLGGSREALAAAEEEADAQGAHCTWLKVDVASHTPRMQEAATGLLAYMSTLSFRKPALPLFSSVLGRVHGEDAARQALARQISNTVRWDDCMENIEARQADCVLEIGPGSALARMWNNHHPTIPARGCDEFRSIEGVAKWVNAVSGASEP